jgi:prevent-host-death family protein
MSTQTVTVTELKVKLSVLMAELGGKGVPFYVTQHGKPKPVLVRYDEYEALLRLLVSWAGQKERGRLSAPLLVLFTVHFF